MLKLATESQISSSGVWYLFDQLSTSRALSTPRSRDLFVRRLEIVQRSLTRLSNWMLSETGNDKTFQFVQSLRSFTNQLVTEILTVGRLEGPTIMRLKWFSKNLERLDSIFAPANLASPFAKMAMVSKQAATAHNPEVYKRVQNAVMSTLSFDDVVKQITSQLIDTANGAKNSREAKRYMDSLAGRLGIDDSVVDAAHAAMFPSKGYY